VGTPPASEPELGWGIKSAPLATRLFLLVVAITIPVGSAMALLWWRAIDHSRSALYAEQRVRVERVARDLENLLSQSSWVLLRMAGRPAVRRLDPAACGEEMRHLSEYHVAYRGITLWSSSGAMICTSLSSALAAPPKPDREAFDRGLNAGGLYLSDVFIGPISKRPLARLSYTVLGEDGRVVGLLAVPIRMEYFEELLATAVPDAHSTAAIVDSAGTYVARLPGGARWRGTKGADIAAVRMALSNQVHQANVEGADGIERSYVFATLAPAGWKILSGVDTRWLLADLHRQMLRDMILFALALILSAGGAYAIGRSITRPLGQLVSVTDAVASGDLAKRSPVEGVREMALVALHLNRMLDSLQAEIARRRLSESNLAAAQRLTHLGSWHVDLVELQELGRNPQGWSDETFRIFGYAPGSIEASLENFIRAVHPDDRPRVLDAFAAAVRGESQYLLEHRIVRPDGRERLVRESAERLVDDAGNPVKMVGTILDITDQRHAENRLRTANEQLRALSSRLLRAEESERLRISRGLHDQIGQELTALKIHLETLARFPDPASLPAKLEEAAVQAGETLERVRQISVDLRPPQLSALGVVPALRSHVERLGELTGLPIELTVEGRVSRFPPDVEIAAFRLVQEALTNVVRHAGATNARVEVRFAERELEVSVHDDGVGFDPKQLAQRRGTTSGLGLLGMEERVALAGGRLRFISRPGSGCEVHAVFPQKQTVEPR